MFLIYLDESGKPERTDSNENYVVAGIIANEENWNEIDEKVTNLRKKLFGQNWELYELHLAEIVHGKNLYKNMALQERINVINSIFDLISSLNIRIVGVLIKKDKMYPGKDIENWALRLLFERICWNLKDLNKNLIAAGQKNQYGLMILDSINNDFDNKIRKKIKNFLLNGTQYQDNEFLIEDALFTCSHWRNLCQLADFVAYAINYHYKTNKFSNVSKHNSIENGYSKILSKIVLKNNSLNWSLKIFP
ncbi:MAG: DUF3800 domain-containing protein [Nanoarchaeota archaeon]|nr:DUF3800 domain-containing protein [Nanoarchaeota archaeon]